MTRWFFVLTLVAATQLTFPSKVLAVSVQGSVRNVPYVIGFHVMNSSAYPYVGQMHLNFNHGVISGTYTDLSIKPGSPFANAHNVPVTGGVTSDHVTLIIRQATFRGTMNGEKMSGSANIRGTIYVFAAQQGTPGSGK